MTGKDKKTWETELLVKCPNLYKDRIDKLGPNESCMHWGFDINPGWHDLVGDLSIKLEALINQIPEDTRNDFKAAQVKEKFGYLRFYMNSSTLAMDNLIEIAENQSGLICENCGESGKIRQIAWFRTLCDKHFNNKEEE